MDTLLGSPFSPLQAATWRGSWAVCFHICHILQSGRRVIIKGCWEKEAKCEAQKASRFQADLLYKWEHTEVQSLKIDTPFGEPLCIPRVTSNLVWGFSSSWLCPCRNKDLRLLDLQFFKTMRNSYFKWYLLIFKWCQLIKTNSVGPRKKYLWAEL